VGRHASRWRWPSQLKPQYRFLLAISGILLLAFTTLAVAASLFPQSPQASAGATPTDEGNAYPGDTGPLPAVTGPVGGQVIAAYAVPDNAVWDSGFQAQVLLTNTTTAAQPWQVTLVYPTAVTGFVASWLDGAPQPSASVDGQRFTFTSTLPIAPGQSALLKVEFSKEAGTNFTLQACAVNGRSCIGA
jgi:hypothetical protein